MSNVTAAKDNLDQKIAGMLKQDRLPRVITRRLFLFDFPQVFLGARPLNIAVHSPWAGSAGLDCGMFTRADNNQVIQMSAVLYAAIAVAATSQRPKRRC